MEAVKRSFESFFLQFLGPTRPMVESQLQRVLLRLGARESAARFRRIGSEVRILENRQDRRFNDDVSASRYGLPVNFQAILIHPNKKNQKRLRDVLNQLYGHLDGSAAGSSSVNADVS